MTDIILHKHDCGMVFFDGEDRLSASFTSVGQKQGNEVTIRCLACGMKIVVESNEDGEGNVVG